MTPHYDPHDLIQRHMAGLTTEDEDTGLRETLKHDDEIARLYLRYMNLDVALEAAASVHAVASPGMQRSTPPAWFSLRPLAAAAAGVVLGLFSASFVWAYAGARTMNTDENSLPLMDGGFESAAAPEPAGVPKISGVWSGDFSAVTQAEQGVQPESGRQMLRMLRSNSSDDPPERPSHGGDMMQLVDLRPWKQSFASGNAVLEVSAAGNRVPPQGGEGYSFAVSASAFSGRPEELPSDQSELAQAALGSGLKRLPLDADPATWQTATARLLLPADADFVLVKLTMTRMRSRQQTGHAEFAGHYADDVKLMLKTPSPGTLK